jgi:UDP-N-acetylglucosamine 2-epimerase (non-hydrolysing)
MKNRLILICFFLIYASWIAGEDFKKPIVLMIGTRPEVIKMIPVYKALKEANLPVLLCSSGQHLDIVDEALLIFKEKLDYNFGIMKPKQDLVYITNSVLEKTTDFLKETQPSLVIVQGDTTTAMAAALASFYCKIPVAHVEAGLRTKNIYAPFPEEMNRQLISKIASLHFSPTVESTLQLESEGIPKDKIYNTGNTVVDALFFIKNQIETGEIEPSSHIQKLVKELNQNGQIPLLFTIHRRESLDGGIEEAMHTLYEYLSTHPKVSILYPAHPNPLIKEIIQKTKLDTLPNLNVLEPLPYHDLIYILLNCRGVLTDSGGIQEEAISLNKFTLILRNETDRPECLSSGFAYLVGTQPELIRQGLDKIFESDIKENPSLGVSPYGDGLAAKRIVEIIKKFLNN